MYLQGVNHDGRFDCEINEIDVAPVQIPPCSASFVHSSMAESVESSSEPQHQRFQTIQTAWFLLLRLLRPL
jgi:hypothetical protein